MTPQGATQESSHAKALRKMTPQKAACDASVDVDNLLQELGARGRWQLRSYGIYLFIYTSLAFGYIPLVFILDTPAHHCRVPANTTQNETIPQVYKDGAWVTDQCNMYVNYTYSKDTAPCSQGWVFDPDSGYSSTAVMDFELVCSRSIFVEVTMMANSVTISVTLLAATWLADMCGRKPVFLIAIVARGVTGVAKAFSPDVTTFIVINILNAAAQGCLYGTIYVLCIELFPTKYRTVAGTSIEFFWFLSIMLVSLLAYLIRDWRVLQVVMYAPTLLAVIAYWYTDESIPWLIAEGKMNQAETILRKAAKLNKTEFPSDIFNKITSSYKDNKRPELEHLTPQKGDLSTDVIIDDGDIPLDEVAEGLDIKVDGGDGQKSVEASTVRHVLKSRKLMFITAINMVLWFTNSVVYMALTLTSVYLSGDRYMNFFLLCLAELPAIASFHWALNKFGRRWPICLYHLLCGAALLSTLTELIGLSTAWVQIGLNFLGKFAITGSYCSLLLYTPELYPTKTRSIFYGLAWSAAYIGEFVAPFTRPLELEWPGMVRGVCGGLCIVGGMLVLLLPETSIRPLPTTVSEVEHWSRTVSTQERKAYNERNANQVKPMAA